jgi:hypothetical protein
MARTKWWAPLALVLAAGCGAPAQEAMPPRHISASQHDQEARRHERQARQSQGAPARGEQAPGGQSSYGCFDQAMPEPDSGGQRVPVLRPCWTAKTQPASDRERDGAAHRRQAARHHAMAATLWRAERRACAGLDGADAARSPFSRRGDIVRVAPLRAGGRVTGARVVFRRADGLDPDWMRRSIACQQARAAAQGYPARSGGGPIAVAPTRATVAASADEIAVSITAARDEDAAAVLGRAEALVDARSP